MPKRLSIYLPDAVHALLGEPASMSARIAKIIEQHHDITTASWPALSRAEWRGVFECMAECDGSRMGLNLLWANVTRQVGIGARLGFDQEALVRKLRDMPYASLVAIAELHRRFRAKQLPLDQALDAIGIPPSREPATEDMPA